MTKALTTRSIEALKPCATRREIRDGGVAGLYLCLQPSGAKSWCFGFASLAGAQNWRSAVFPSIGVTTARALASSAAVEVARGQNPAQAKRDRQRAAEPAKDIFKRVAAEFIERHVKPNTRARSSREIARLLTRETKSWSGRRLSDLKRADVAKLLEGIIERGAPVVANRTLEALARMGAWAVERSLIDASPFATIRPPTKEPPFSRFDIRRNQRRMGRLRRGRRGDAVVRVLTLTGRG